jgi:hypothetical protein
MASSYGNYDAACCARYFSAMSLALAGDGEGARAMIEQALAAARSLDDPFSLALTLYFTSAAAQMLGDVPLATANSELSVRMATEYDLAQPKAWSMGVAGLLKTATQTAVSPWRRRPSPQCRRSDRVISCVIC